VLFLAALLVVRGLPALVYLGAIGPAGDRRGHAAPGTRPSLRRRSADRHGRSPGALVPARDPAASAPEAERVQSAADMKRAAAATAG
jgi:hypothetical protein